MRVKVLYSGVIIDVLIVANTSSEVRCMAEPCSEKAAIESCPLKDIEVPLQPNKWGFGSRTTAIRPPLQSSPADRLTMFATLNGDRIAREAAMFVSVVAPRITMTRSWRAGLRKRRLLPYSNHGE